MRRTLGVAVIAVVAVSAAGGFGWRQWSQARDLEGRVERLEKDLDLERAKAGRDLAAARLRLRRAEKRRAKMEAVYLDQDSCAGQLADVEQAGEHVISFGFIRGFDAAPGVLLFDRAEWLSGEDAQRAAEEEGEISPGEPLPNDYYIRNPTEGTVPKRLDKDTLVVLTRGRGHSFPTARCGTARELERAFRNPRGWHELIHHSPYWIVESGGRVIRVVEQYLP